VICSAGGVHSSNASLVRTGVGVNLSAGTTGTFSSRPWCGRSELYCSTQASTAACAASSEVNGPCSLISGRKVP
jgi:hypothetical protein